MIKNHLGGAKQIPTGAARMVKNDQDTMLADIERGYKEYGKYNQSQIDAALSDEKIVTDPFIYSKWQVVKLFDVISGISNDDDRDQLCEDLLLYAGSQSSISAPYYKLQ